MPTSSTLNEKDMLHDLLVIEKDLVKNYGNYLTEAACPKLRTTLNNNLKGTAADQFTIFSEMTARGYYPVKQAEEQEVTQAKQQFNQILNKMS